MHYLTPLALISALGLAAQASADVSAQEVWLDVKDILSTFGTVSGDVENTDDKLTITRLKIDGTKGGAFILSEPIALISKPNGTVDFVIPAEMAPRWVTQSSQYIKVNTTHDALVMTASGDREDVKYTVSAKRFAAEFETRANNLKNFSDAKLEILDFHLRTNKLDEGPHAREAHLMAKSMTTFVASATGMPFSWTTMSTFTDAQMNFAYNIPPEVLEKGINSTSFDGLRLDLGLTYAQGQQEDTGGKKPTGSSTADHGRIVVKIDDELAEFSASAENLTGPLKINSAILPASLKVDTLAMSFSLPIGYSDAPSEADLRVNIDGLTLPDLVWRMFDPARTLPRTPVSLNFDLTGTGNFKKRQDTIPEALRGLIKPSVLQSLTINKLDLNLLDTALNATGKFSFDHTDIPDGAIPDTSGALDLEILGLNGLIDTFAELDILPQAQFLAFKAMIGFIATQSDTEDKLNSRIEIAPGGSITANGFRVR